MDTNTDKFGRIILFSDYKGKMQPVKYPKGKTYAVCKAVCIIRQKKDTYAVVYGLQVKENLSHEQAATEFGFCALHQSECEQAVA